MRLFDERDLTRIAQAMRDKVSMEILRQSQHDDIRASISVVSAGRAWEVPMLVRLWVDNGHYQLSKNCATVEELREVLRGEGL